MALLAPNESFNGLQADRWMIALNARGRSLVQVEARKRSRIGGFREAFAQRAGAKAALLAPNESFNGLPVFPS